MNKETDKNPFAFDLEFTNNKYAAIFTLTSEACFLFLESA